MLTTERTTKIIKDPSLEKMVHSITQNTKKAPIETTVKLQLKAIEKNYTSVGPSSNVDHVCLLAKMSILVINILVMRIHIVFK